MTDLAMHVPDGPTPTERATALPDLLIGLGTPVVLFWGAMLYRWSHTTSHVVAFTDTRLLSTLAVEALVVATVFPWLLHRGWSPRRCTAPPEPRDLARALGIWFAATALSYIVQFALAVSSPAALTALHAMSPVGHPSLWVVSEVSLFNPVFEEFLWLGFTVPALIPRLGVRGAAAVSVLLRVSVHLYQGLNAIAGVLPVALMLTWYYVRTRRLWPVIVAHGIMDFIGLVFLGLKH